jgi:2-haloacid dehalogenase
MAERWATFDCYGTLVDWRSGLVTALAPMFGRDAERFLISCLAHHFELECEKPHRMYREVLIEGLRRAADREEIVVEDAELFVEAWPSFQVFSDVAEAVHTLRARDWRLAVLTNCDDDLFAQTARCLAFDLDEVVTAEQVQSYKPQLDHLEEFRRRTLPKAGHWIHVANSWVADIEPASRFGTPTIWVNRDRDDYDSSLAAAVLTDFVALPDTIDQVMPRMRIRD